jgi:hypothetical protein
MSDLDRVIADLVVANRILAREGVVDASCPARGRPSW